MLHLRLKCPYTVHACTSGYRCHTKLPLEHSPYRLLQREAFCDSATVPQEFHLDI